MVGGCHPLSIVVMTTEVHTAMVERLVRTGLVTRLTAFVSSPFCMLFVYLIPKSILLATL